MAIGNTVVYFTSVLLHVHTDINKTKNYILYTVLFPEFFSINIILYTVYMFLNVI